MLAFAFVASPFDRDPAGARSWLVGFLLHPVPRTGTWRRLVSPGLGPTPGAGLLRFQRSWRTCRLGGKTANRQHLNFTGFAVFSQGLVQPLWINKLLVFLNLHTAKPWMKGAECYPHPFTQTRAKSLSLGREHREFRQNRRAISFPEISPPGRLVDFDSADRRLRNRSYRPDEFFLPPRVGKSFARRQAPLAPTVLYR
jgi:hypothetical protein